jgi:hypothetical protein
MFSTLATYAKAALELIQTPWVIMTFFAAYNVTMLICLWVTIQGLGSKNTMSDKINSKGR